MLSGVLGLQGGILNFNTESSRIANRISSHNPESRVENIINTNPESKAESMVNAHPTAVKVACALWAKGICVAVKVAKASSTMIAESTANKNESKTITN